MKKNKKLLMSLLTLNAILSVHASGAEVSTKKYDRMYNSIVKNTAKKENNKKTYQTIERILKQKNKELKDLHLQGDYIVKPEYLEWQIFFAGFYNEDARTGSLSSNHAREGNDSESNWSGKNKPMIQGDSYKDFKAGPSIPLKYLNLQDINPNITTPVIESIAPINLNKTPLVIDMYQLPSLPNIQINTINATNVNDINITKNVQVNPLNINVTSKSFGSVVIPSSSLSSNGNGYYSSADVENLFTNIETLGTTTLLSSSGKSGLIQIIGVKNSTYLAPTPVYSPGDLTYVLNQNLATESPGSRIVILESHRGTPIPASSGSTPGDLNEVLLVTTTGTLSINSNDSIAAELEQGYGDRTDSVYINQGTITSTYSNVIGVDFKGGPAGPVHAENLGLITLAGNSNVGIKSVNLWNGAMSVGIINDVSGVITLNGTSSVGIVIADGSFNPVTITATNYTGGSYTTGLRQDGTINVNGTGNLGVVIRD